MTRAKQVKAYAKSLLNLCVVEGELSDERVAAVLQVMERNPPRHYGAVLKALLHLVEREVANRTAIVEHAGALSESTIQKLRDTLAAKYDRSIDVQSRENPALIAGLRVRIGCDVYDSSIAGSLRELQSSLS